MASKKHHKKKRRGKKPGQKKTTRQATSYQSMVERVKAFKDMEFIIEPPGETKMSEVILDFAEPFLEDAPDYQTKRNMIGIMIIAWNMSLLPFFSRIVMLRNIRRDKNMDKESMKVIKMFGRMMKRYRKQFHPSLKRFILDYEFSETRNDFHLNVVSTVSPPKGYKGSGHA